MLLVLGSYALGRHAYFFREGDVITTAAVGSAVGAATASNQPAATDAAYINLGPINDWDDDFKAGKTEEIWLPSPGKLLLTDEIDIKVKQMIKFTTEQVTAFAIESAYRTTQKLTSAGGQFNPNSAQPRRGWLHTELYDQNDNFFAALDLWGRLRVTGGMSGKDGGLVKPQFEMTVYYSALNTGLINNT